MTRRLGRLFVASLTVLFSTALFIGSAYAGELQSTHYQLSEGTIGNGGLVQSNSTNFQSTESLGSTAVGDTSSTNFQIQTGPKTTPDPGLAFSVTSSSASFGNFSSTQVATTTATFMVADYTSYGYAVQIIGNPPSNGGHTIAALSSTDISRPGQEQFGLNVVANTGFGANPDQGQFGAGVAAANYNTADHFRYVSGETIATAPKTSGVTTFTISYIINVTSLTPGGAYTSNQSVVCTGTF